MPFKLACWDIIRWTVIGLDDMTNVSNRTPYENKLFSNICAWTPHLCTSRHLPFITLWQEERQMLNLQVLNSVQLLPLDQRTAAVWKFFQRDSTDLFMRGRSDKAWSSGWIIWCLRQAPAGTFSATETFAAPFSHMELKRISLIYNSFPSPRALVEASPLSGTSPRTHGLYCHWYFCPLLSWPVSAERLYRVSECAHKSLNWAVP